MRKYIEKLQSKNETIRSRILIGSLVVCMSIVFTIWISSLGYKFGNEKVANTTEEEIKPFTILGQSISKTYNSVTASVGNISSLKKDGKEEKQINLIPVEYQ